MKFKTTTLQACIAVTIFFFTLSPIHAQSAMDKYQTESIYLKGKKYIKNGVEYPITSWNGDLKKEMEISPDAVMEYAKFQKQHNTSFFIGATGVVSFLSAFFINNDDLQSVLFLGGAGLVFVSIPLSRKANVHLEKSIWLRNGAVLK